VAASLQSLASAELLARLQHLVRRGNAVEAELLVHLGEVDARRLYLGEGCSSMFVYCQRVLHFAEGVAYKRIGAARAARRYPEILEAVRRGDVHVTGVSLLVPQLTAASCGELIRAASHRTADEIRRLLADRRPKPDVAASVRRAPEPEVAVAITAPRAHVRPEPAGATAPARPVSAPNEPGPRARTEPLGGERYCVRFTADRQLHEQLQELRALMRHQVPDGDVGKILARAVAVLLEQVRKRKFGKCSAPRPAKLSKARPARQIPARIRRAVAKRDAERCTYLSPAGRRCGAREFLEFHHLEPWARSASHSIEGISLRCRAHNQYEACRDFGDRHMDRYRRSRASDGEINENLSGGLPAFAQLDSDPVRQI
jgi:hypothetical protein